MKIKRNYTYISAIRAFKVFINDEHVSDLKLLKEVEVEQPTSPFTVHFTTMKLEKSSKYIVDTNKPVRIVTNVNPIVRITYWLFFISIPIFITLFIDSISSFISYMFMYLVLYGMIYFLILTRIYITFKVYDLDNNLIEIEKLY